jgi:predicted metal-dependent phosphoesterase TrpH/ABC-type lipoprotein export system ATPase subunit
MSSADLANAATPVALTPAMQALDAAPAAPSASAVAASGYEPKPAPTPPGSRWWKFDFHCHTPASSDYNGDKSITPTQWLQDYRAAGIDCVVVTDHNTGAWIDKLKQALAALRLTDPTQWDGFNVFPGMELSCNGGVHLKVVLDPCKTGADIDAIRGAVRYDGTPGDSDGVTQLSLEQVIDAIHAAGGIACAALVDCPKGLFTLNDHHTVNQVLAKLDALEVINLQAASMARLQGNPAALALAQVLGSDSHKPSEIGRGYTWVKMSTPSLDGLRLALLDPALAIHRSDTHPTAPQAQPGQWIESIRLENLHLIRKTPLDLSFNPGYTAVIGGRGSGKSTVLECLRLALAQGKGLKNAGGDILNNFEKFQKEYSTNDKVGMMLPNTWLTAIVVRNSSAGVQRMRYEWRKQLDGRFATQVASEKAPYSDLWEPTALTEAQASEQFPVNIYSQKQVLALANQPQALLEEIDARLRLEGNYAAWEQRFEAAKTALLAARLRLRTLNKELVKKPEIELAHKDAKRKALVFSNSNFGDLLKAYQRASEQQRGVDGFYDLLAKDLSALQAGLVQAANLGSTELHFAAQTPAELAVQAAALATQAELVQQYESIAAAVAAMQNQLSAARSAIAASAWQQENSAHIQAYQQEGERLKAAGISSAQEAAIAVEQEARLGQQLEQLKVYERDQEAASQAVDTAAKALSDCRKEKTALREAVLSEMLKDNTLLRVTLRSMADVDTAAKEIRSVLRLEVNIFKSIIFEEGDDPANEQGKFKGFIWDATHEKEALKGKNDDVHERLQLMKAQLEGGEGNVLSTKLRADFIKKIMENKEKYAQIFDELACWFPEDEVTLEYRRNPSSGYSPIASASAGQKTAAMLSYLLAQGTTPLLLDQPEDDLDNRLVSDLVVHQLRENKTKRQLIVVTHNANIVVNADADLVIAMEYSAGQIKKASADGLQSIAVRNDICSIMEGGKDAFEQRYKRILKDLEPRK